MLKRNVEFDNVKVRSQNKYTIEQARGQTCPIFRLQSKCLCQMPQKDQNETKPALAVYLLTLHFLWGRKFFFPFDRNALWCPNLKLI